MSPRSPQQRLADMRDAIDTIADHRQEARQVGLPDSSDRLPELRRAIETELHS